MTQRAVTTLAAGTAPLT